MKCPNCDGRMVRKVREHKTRIGAITVTDSTAMIPTCTKCGTASLSQDELAGYERRAAKMILTSAEHVGGDVLKFARKSLGLRQKDLATLLDSNDQQVSRWEHATEIDRRLRLAMVALLDVAEHGQDGFSELAANNSKHLEIIRAAS